MDYYPSILIVDGMLTGRKTLELLLKEDGYRLAFASNGIDALRRAGDFEPDVILLDVMMPDIDGIEVCQWMLNDPNLLDVPILLLSSLTERDDRLKGIGAGNRKPLDKGDAYIPPGCTKALFSNGGQSGHLLLAHRTLIKNQIVFGCI